LQCDPIRSFIQEPNKPHQKNESNVYPRDTLATTPHPRRNTRPPGTRNTRQSKLVSMQYKLHKQLHFLKFSIQDPRWISINLPLPCQTKQGCLTETNCPCLPAEDQDGSSTSAANTGTPLIGACQWPPNQRYCNVAIPNCVCVV